MSKFNFLVRRKSIEGYVYTITKFLSPAFNILLSVLVIRLNSASLWGNYVKYFIAIQLMLHIASWGHRDYLLKVMSEEPSKAESSWKSNFYARSFLLIVLILFMPTMLPITPNLMLILTGWMVITFIHQSFEVLIIYERKFRLLFNSELISGIVMLLGVVLSDNLSLQNLFLILLISAITKLMILLKSLYYLVSANSCLISGFKMLKYSLPFFIPGIIGLIQSKIDLYYLAYMSDSEELANYQVFRNLLGQIHMVIMLMMTPYIKNIYRAKGIIWKKLRVNFSIIGFILTVLGLIFTYLLITFFYQIKLPEHMYLAGFLFTIPFLYFYFIIYKLFKINKPYLVALFSLGSAIINIILGLNLLPSYGILGVMIASTIAQWALFICYLISDYRFNLSQKSFVNE